MRTDDQNVTRIDGTPEQKRSQLYTLLDYFQKMNSFLYIYIHIASTLSSVLWVQTILLIEVYLFLSLYICICSYTFPYIYIGYSSFLSNLTQYNRKLLIFSSKSDVVWREGGCQNTEIIQNALGNCTLNEVYTWTRHTTRDSEPIGCEVYDFDFKNNQQYEEEVFQKFHACLYLYIAHCFAYRWTDINLIW